MHVFIYVRQKTAYELRISDWSSDVCSSDLKHEEGVTIPDVSGIVSCSRIRSESDVFGDRIEEAVEGLRVGGVGVGSEFILLEEIDYLEELTAAGFLTRVACSNGCFDVHPEPTRRAHGVQTGLLSFCDRQGGRRCLAGRWRGRSAEHTSD